MAITLRKKKMNYLFEILKLIIMALIGGYIGSYLTFMFTKKLEIEKIRMSQTIDFLNKIKQFHELLLNNLNDEMTPIKIYSTLTADYSNSMLFIKKGEREDFDKIMTEYLESIINFKQEKFKEYIAIYGKTYPKLIGLFEKHFKLFE